MEPKYYHQVVGGNFRLDALQAAVLRVKLPFLDGWSAARRRNADRYRALLHEAGLAGRVVPPEDVPGHIYNQFVIRFLARPAAGVLRSHAVGTRSLPGTAAPAGLLCGPLRRRSCRKRALRLRRWRR
jgi:dTDP-4-amino-4,6-dideoxygalactose transaminase